jgi:hypothetical protein
MEKLLGSNEQLEQFYNKKFYFSYSGINKLLFSPDLFYKHYILNQREDSTDQHLVEGRVLHCLLFEEDTFNDKFLVMPGKIPTDSQQKIIYNLFKYELSQGLPNETLDHYTNEILNELISANLYQTLKTDAQRLDKILTLENTDYFTFLQNSQYKTVVDQVTLDNCKIKHEVLKNNRHVRSLLQLDNKNSNDKIQCYNEFKIESNILDLPFGLHGIIDNIVVDNDSKTIFVNDLKTTAKNIQDFPKTVDYYKYWIQAIIYSKLCKDYFLKENPDKDSWNIVITFIVIDKYNQVYPFQVSEETFVKWNTDFDEIIKEITWHYVNRRYDLPYALALDKITL